MSQKPHILDFDGDDTVQVTAGDLPPGEFPPIPEAELPEGWQNLSHRKTHANMTNITECFWTDEGFVLRVHLLLGDAEQVDQRQTFPVSSNLNDADKVKILFEEVCKEPINIESKIMNFLTNDQSKDSSAKEIFPRKSFIRRTIDLLFGRE